MADFYKYHALGNDYLVIDPQKLDFQFMLSNKNISLICSRNHGIGSDGILYGPIIEDEYKIVFKIFNPDGSEAEKSGNGIRIFALYLLDQMYVKEKCFYLYTKSGKVSVELIDSKSNLIRIGMGRYSFISDNIPMLLDQKEVINQEIKVLGKTEIVNCVNIGNPHCVLFNKDVTEKLVRKLGPAIENHELFPNKVNVQLVKVLDKSNIKIEIWERGAGYTLASGTSSCAASCVSHKLGLVKKNVIVHMPGGMVNVEIADDELYLTGVVERVVSGFFTDDLKNKLVSYI